MRRAAFVKRPHCSGDWFNTVGMRLMQIPINVDVDDLNKATHFYESRVAKPATAEATFRN